MIYVLVQILFIFYIIDICNIFIDHIPIGIFNISLIFIFINLSLDFKQLKVNSVNTKLQMLKYNKHF